MGTAGSEALDPPAAVDADIAAETDRVKMLSPSSLIRGPKYTCLSSPGLTVGWLQGVILSSRTDIV